MTNPPEGPRVVINEGALKKNINPPPSSPRPPAPAAQVVPRPQQPAQPPQPPRRGG